MRDVASTEDAKLIWYVVPFVVGRVPEVQWDEEGLSLYHCENV